MESTWQTLRMLAGFVAVLALAIWGTRLLARRPGPSSGGRYLRLVEVISMGHNRHICLVRVGRHHQLLGLTDRTMIALGAYEDLEPCAGDEAASLQPFDIYRSVGLRLGLPCLRRRKEDDHEV
ncbi:MAG: flagellar biosynthetic protein FliO [Bacillota bacterium]